MSHWPLRHAASRSFALSFVLLAALASGSCRRSPVTGEARSTSTTAASAEVPPPVGRAHVDPARAALEETTPGTPDGGVRLPRGREDCAACGGEWGPQGMLGRPGCVCPTRDGGNPCSSDAECENRCELTEAEADGRIGLRCGPQGCVGPGAERGMPQGRCARDDDRFGCHISITSERRADGVWREIQSLCVD